MTCLMLVIDDPEERTTLRPVRPFSPCVCTPDTWIDASALPSRLLIVASDRTSVVGERPGGAHAGPAENAFGDEQFPFWWKETRYSPIGMLIADTSSVIPSPLSITRTL